MTTMLICPLLRTKKLNSCFGLAVICETDSLQTDMMQNSADELLTLWRLQVDGRLTKAPIWRSFGAPPPGWLKVNTDGAAFGGRCLIGCAGVFRRCRGFFKSSFAILIGICFAFEVDLAADVHVIEYAKFFSWKRLWLESDSAYLMALLNSRSRLVSWR